MAGAGKKTFAVNEVLSAADVNNYLMDQSVMRFADSTARSSAIPSPDEGMVSYLDDTNQVEVYDGSGWVNFTGDITQVTAGTALTGGGTEGNVTLNVDETELFTGGTAGYTALSNGTAGLSYQPVSHNYIINGAFDIWQRGTSFSHANGYFADRWEANYSTAFPTGTLTLEQFTPDDLTAIGYGEGEYYFRSAITSVNGSSRTSIRQKVEDVRSLANQQVTISFFARSSVNGTLSLAIVQRFDSASTDNVASLSSFALSSSWQRYTRTFTMDSISGKTIGANSFIELRFDVPLSDNSTLDLWGVQLEAGSIATPFKRNANSIAGELAACQRYYEKNDTAQNIYNADVTSGFNYRQTVDFKVPKRTESPTVTPLNITNNLFPSGDPAAEVVNANGFRATKQANGTGTGFFIFGYIAEDEL